MLTALLEAAGPFEYFAALVGVLALVALFFLYRRDRKARKVDVPVVAPASTTTERAESVEEDLPESPPLPNTGAFKTYIPPADDPAAP